MKVSERHGGIESLKRENFDLVCKLEDSRLSNDSLRREVATCNEELKKSRNSVRNKSVEILGTFPHDLFLIFVL